MYLRGRHRYRLVIGGVSKVWMVGRGVNVHLDHFVLRFMVTWCTSFQGHNITFMHQKGRLRVASFQKWAFTNTTPAPYLSKPITKNRKHCNYQQSWGSLQVYICAGGFRVCKTKQTYVTLSHALCPIMHQRNKRFMTNKHTNVKI